MILITGGMGFIGLHTARAFLDAGEDVVITRYQTWREPPFIKDEYGKRVHIERLDTTSPFDTGDLLRKYNVDGIVHLAVPGLGALSPAEDIRVNVLSLLHVLEAARVQGVKRVSIGSSTPLYAGLKQGPFQEDAYLPLHPTSYSETFKKTQEILACHYADRTGLDVTFLRISVIWGPVYHSGANLPSRMVHGALQGQVVDFANLPSGVPFEEDNADLCYGPDCGRCIQGIHMSTRLTHRAYNVGSGVATSNAQLRDAVVKAVPGAQIVLRPGRGQGYRPNACLDMTRTFAETDYRPQFDVERGVADYLAWLRAGNTY
jgi:UDP-glucose 4-epimerase